MVPDDLNEELQAAVEITNMQDILTNQRKPDSMLGKLQRLKDEIKDEANEPNEPAIKN